MISLSKVVRGAFLRMDVVAAIVLAVSMGLTACRRTPAVPPISPSVLVAADSVALQQYPGAVAGEWRRIVIRRSGAATVVRDSARARPRRLTVRRDVYQRVVNLAVAADFGALPDTIPTHPVFGHKCGSDPVIVIVTVYAANVAKKVVDDSRCVWAPTALRELERAIIQAAGEK